MQMNGILRIERPSRHSRHPGRLAALSLGGALLIAAGQAQAVPQYTPTAGARLHTTASGQPGAEWNTGGTGAGGNISYTTATGDLQISGVLDVLNFFDPANGGCATDLGSNCAENFSPDLDFTLNAKFLEASGVETFFAGSNIFSMSVVFGTSGGLQDLLLTDPDDGGSTQLTADIVAGTLNGDAVDGLVATVLFNATTGTSVFQAVNSAGILNPTGGPFATLFDSGTDSFGLSLNVFDDFVPDLDALLVASAASCTPGVNGGGFTTLSNCSLPLDFTAEANGQIFRITQGEFVIPEPGTAILVALGLIGIGARRRS